MWRDCPLDAAACVSAVHGNATFRTAKPTQTATVLDTFDEIEVDRSHGDIFIGTSRSLIFISLFQPAPDELRSGAELTILGVADSA
jgi:hypothetical protein